MLDGKLFDTYPKLYEYLENVENLPGLKEYLEDPSCPEKTRQFNNKHSVINNQFYISKEDLSKFRSFNESEGARGGNTHAFTALMGRKI